MSSFDEKYVECLHAQMLKTSDPVRKAAIAALISQFTHKRPIVDYMPIYALAARVNNYNVDLKYKRNYDSD